MQSRSGNVDRAQTLLAVALAAIAGAVDALGFITLRGFFVSFMTGNTTRMAVGFAHGRWHEAAIGGTIIALFVAGAISGFTVARLVAASPKQAVALLLTTALLAAAICHDAGADRPAIASMTFGMGAENAIFQSRSGRAIGLTYMTGALVKMASQIVEACTGGPPLRWLRELALWAALACGAALGALAHRWIGLDALWLVVAAASLVAVALRRLPAGA